MENVNSKNRNSYWWRTKGTYVNLRKQQRLLAALLADFYTIVSTPQISKYKLQHNYNWHVKENSNWSFETFWILGRNVFFTNRGRRRSPQDKYSCSSGNRQLAGYPHARAWTFTAVTRIVWRYCAKLFLGTITSSTSFLIHAHNLQTFLQTIVLHSLVHIPPYSSEQLSVFGCTLNKFEGMLVHSTRYKNQ